jgi:hypothetical protein
MGYNARNDEIRDNVTRMQRRGAITVSRRSNFLIAASSKDIDQRPSVRQPARSPSARTTSFQMRNRSDTNQLSAVVSLPMPEA